MPDEQLRIAVFIDYDNVEIGVRTTMSRDFDVALVLESLKERGEVISKIAYGNWKRHGNASRMMSEQAVQMVQRDPTPRGDKNGADINLALDALEMAFTKPHINAYAIVGGDSDFIALVEKLKQYNKGVFVVGGRGFTSGILQKNCREFISYENLVPQQEQKKPALPRRPMRRGETQPAENARPLLERALKLLVEREHTPLLGLVKSTMLQLDSTFSERDYGSNSFLDFAQKLEAAGISHLERTGSNYAIRLPEFHATPAVEAAPAARSGAGHAQAPAAHAHPAPAHAARAGAQTAPAAEHSEQAGAKESQAAGAGERRGRRRGGRRRTRAGSGFRAAAGAAAEQPVSEQAPHAEALQPEVPPPATIQAGLASGGDPAGAERPSEAAEPAPAEAAPPRKRRTRPSTTRRARKPKASTAGQS